MLQMMNVKTLIVLLLLVMVQSMRNLAWIVIFENAEASDLEFIQKKSKMQQVQQKLYILSNFRPIPLLL